jgi:hypothetical protein
MKVPVDAADLRSRREEYWAAGRYWHSSPNAALCGAETTRIELAPNPRRQGHSQLQAMLVCVLARMAASARIVRSAMAYPDPRQAIAAQPAKPRGKESTELLVALLGAAGGAVYGVLTLIAGVGAIAWLVLLIVVSRRRPLRALPLTAVGFVVGFAIAFLGLLVPTTLSCQPPSCFATPWNVDLTWAVVDLVVAAAVFGIARLGMFLATLARRT